LVFALFPRRSLGEVFFMGGAVGWCMIALFSRLFPLSLWPLFLGIMYIVTGAAVFRAVSRPSDENITRLSESALLWLSALLAFALQLIPAQSGVLPPGKHSMYHLLPAAKTLKEGVVPGDWLPFANIPMHLPLGSHLWTALLAKLGYMPVHYAFRISFPIAALFIGGVMYLLAMQIFKDKRSSFFSALLWMTVSNWGGKQLFMEGQLPHMLGMLLIMSLLWFMSAENNFRGRVVMGVIFGGIIYCQHHAILVVAGLTVMTIVTERAMNGRLGPWSKSLLVAALIGAVLVPEGVIRGVGLLIHPANTELYKFRQYFIPIQMIFQGPGILVTIAGVLGLTLLFARPSQERLVPLIWITSLLAMLALFGYLYRIIVFGCFGEFYAMFTPTALIASLTCPLCLAGGWYIGNKKGFLRFRAISALLASILYLGFSYFFAWHKLGKGDFLSLDYLPDIKIPLILLGFFIVYLFSSKANRPSLDTGAAVIVALLFVIGGWFSSAVQAAKTLNVIGIGDITDFHLMKKYIPPDALVLNRPAGAHDEKTYGWAPYWIWNECTYLVLPSTEERNSPELEFKKGILHIDVNELKMQSHIQARPIILLTLPMADYSRHGFRIIYQSKRRRFQLYEP